MEKPDGKAAAIIAGYSPRTAKSQASRLLTNVNLAAYLEKLRAGRSKRVQVDADYVLRNLQTMFEADILEILKDDGNIRALCDIPEHVRKVIAGLEIHETRISERVSVRTAKVKLLDRLTMLRDMGKHVSVMAFREAKDSTEGLHVIVLRDYTGVEHERAAELERERLEAEREHGSLH